MWFANALFYRFSEDVPFTEEQLTEAMAEHLARDCGDNDQKTVGWTAPFGEDAENLLEVANGYWMVAMQVKERILPAAVIKEKLKAKIKEIEQRDDRKVYKAERDTLKDDIVQVLLPQAFIRTSIITACIAPKEGWIAVNATTAAKAEDVLNLLRTTTGSLPVRPLNVTTSPMATMTQWVVDGRAADGFTISDSCVLVDQHEDGGTVNCKGQDLASDDIQQMLSAGKAVKRLGMSWEDKISFSLDNTLAIKSIKYEELLQDEAFDQAGESKGPAHKQATMVIVAGTLSGLLKGLVSGLGGETETATATAAA